MSERISMAEAVAWLLDLGLMIGEIGEAFARTGPDGEEPLAVANEIVARRADAPTRLSSTSGASGATHRSGPDPSTAFPARHWVADRGPSSPERDAG